MPKFTIDLTSSDLLGLTPAKSIHMIDTLEQKSRRAGALIVRIDNKEYQISMPTKSVEQRRARAKRFLGEVVRAAHSPSVKHAAHKKIAAKTERSRILLAKVRSTYPIDIGTVKKKNGT